MSDEKKKRYQKEASFSLHSLIDQVSEGLSGLGEAFRRDGEAEQQPAQEYEFQEALGDAQRAELRLNIQRAQTTIRSLPPDSDQLLEANLQSLTPVECVVSGGEEKKIRLGAPDGGKAQFRPSSWKRHENLQWQVALSPRLPLRLRVNSGLGENTLLLQELNLRELEWNGGAGKATMLLPATADPYRARLRCGAGAQEVNIADGAELELDAEFGAGKFTLRPGADCRLEGTISGGAGACEIELPADATVWVRLRSGIGQVSLPEHFTPQGAAEDAAKQKEAGGHRWRPKDGVWVGGYDPDSEEAAIRLTIQSGVGKIQIRQAELV